MSKYKVFLAPHLKYFGAQISHTYKICFEKSSKKASLVSIDFAEVVS